MKFLCVPCDEPMKVLTVTPPDRGSISVTYGCPACGYEMAMLTNPFETQLVSSLGVKVGPEGTRRRGDKPKCPFSGMVAAAEQTRRCRRRRDPVDGGGLGADAGRSRTSSGRWRRPGSRSSPRRAGTRRSPSPCSTRPSRASGCELHDGTRRGLRAPYVVSWNLTYRCNLACEHCYLDAGGKPLVEDPAFSDRSELTTAQCFKVVDDIAAFAPEAVTILTGGEPLLRRDILEIVALRERHGALGRRRDQRREDHAERSRRSSQGRRARPVAVARRSGSRPARPLPARVGAWRNTVEGAPDPARRPASRSSSRRRSARTTSDELAAIAEFAHGARRQGLEPVLPRPDGARRVRLGHLARTVRRACSRTSRTIQRAYAGKMLVNAKCAPHYVKTLFEREPASPFLKTLHRRGRRAVRRARTTSASARTATSPPARTFRSSAAICARRASPPSGPTSEPFVAIRQARLAGRPVRRLRAQHGCAAAAAHAPTARPATSWPRTRSARTSPAGSRALRAADDLQGRVRAARRARADVGRRRAGAHEARPRVRPRNGGEGGRVLLPEERDPSASPARDSRPSGRACRRPRSSASRTALSRPPTRYASRREDHRSAESRTR